MNEPSPDGGRVATWLIMGVEGYGVGRSTLELATALRARDWELTFVSCADGPLVRRLQDSEFTVQVLARKPPKVPAPRLGQRLLAVLDWAVVARAIEKHCRRTETTEPQVIIVRTAALLASAGRLGRRWPCALPVWYMASAPRPGGRGALNARILRSLLHHHRVVPVANSVFTAESLRRGSVTPVRVCYLGNSATDVSLDQHDVAARPLDAPARFVMTARLCHDKAQLEVVDALAAIVPGAELVLVGHGSPTYTAAIERRAADHGLQIRVRLVGQVDDTRPYLLDADVAICGQRDGEPFGQAIVEAHAAGRPVLAFGPGGGMELIDDGQTGWWCRSPTPDELAAALRRCMRARDAWAAMGAAGQRTAAERWSASRMAASFSAAVEHEELVRDVGDGRSRPGAHETG